MEPKIIIQKLAANKSVFHSMLTGIDEHEYSWKPSTEQWSLLEILCHLLDEEKEDFRMRLAHVLYTPGDPLPPVMPLEWVEIRQYRKQNYVEKLHQFLAEREESIAWLQQLQQPRWDNASIHPKYGPMTAKMFLINWLAHDYLHIRQITRVKYQYLKVASGDPLKYAGRW